MSSLHEDLPPIYLDTELAVAQIGDVVTMQGMLTMLEETLQRDIPQISSLLSGGDLVAANRLLHPLKGFLPIFCGEALCSDVARVELLSKNGSCAAVAAAYGELRPELDVLLAEVSAYLNAD